MTAHRDMPQTITYTTSPSSSHGSRRTSTSSRRSSGSTSHTSYTDPSPPSSPVQRSSTSHVSKYTLGDTESDQPTGSARFSSYTPTTLSSYRGRIEVEGLPGPKYFSSGQSKTDRRREYIQPPTPPSHAPSSLRSGRSAAGKELIKYRENYDSSDEGAGRQQDSDDEDGADDSRTLRPCDSISQVSYPSSYTSSRGRRSRKDGGISGSVGGSSTFSKISTFQSEQVFDGTRQCYLVERRPRASALAVR